MSLPVILRPEATRDLADARAWYERQRAGLGAIFANRVAASVDRVGQCPEMYAVLWRDVRAAPVRRHPYLIYYRVLADRVEVFAVLHATRDESEWKSRA